VLFALKIWKKTYHFSYTLGCQQRCNVSTSSTLAQKWRKTHCNGERQIEHYVWLRTYLEFFFAYRNIKRYYWGINYKPCQHHLHQNTKWGIYKLYQNWMANRTVWTLDIRFTCASGAKSYYATVPWQLLRT
jgi:hypothetical protein